MKILDGLLSRARRIPSLPYDPAEEAGWDKLWTIYLDRYAYQRQTQAELRLPELPAGREQMVGSLDMHAPPEAIRGRIVLEVGSGAGLLAKRIAVFTEQYVGIDWSSLALSVARETCPERTTFLHATDRAGISKYATKVDTVVCRAFMIHQPFKRARSLLSFDAAMLRPDGRIYADFWQDNADKHDGHSVWSCHTPKSMHNAVYRYTDEDIATLADRSGLVIDDVYDRPDKLRHFVTFRRP